MNLADILHWDRHPLHWSFGVSVIHVGEQVHALDAVFSCDVVTDDPHI